MASAVVAGVDRHRFLEFFKGAGGVDFSLWFFGILRRGAGSSLVLAGHVLVQEGPDFRLGHRPDESVHRLPVLEHHAKRDAAHAEHLRQLTGNLRLVV